MFAAQFIAARFLPRCFPEDSRSRRVKTLFWGLLSPSLPAPQTDSRDLTWRMDTGAGVGLDFGELEECWVGFGV